MRKKLYNFLIGKLKKIVTKKPETQILIRSNGCRLSIPNDMIWAFEGGEYYEKNVIYFLDKIIKNYKEPVFIDVGANYGYYSIKYSSQCIKIFSFEPVTSTYNVLFNNIKNNSITNIIAFKNGLSDIEDERLINLYSSSGNNSIFERNIPESHHLKKIGVESIELLVLDELVNSDRVAVPDIIKIDVEGAELNVLRGAKNTILKYRPAVLLEFSENTSKDAGYSKNILLTSIDLKNYKIFGIPEHPNDLRLIPEKDFASEELSNLIFLPSELDLLN